MSEIKQTLIDVRKAYRFLYNYQRTLMDLVDYIGRKYNFKYEGGYSKFSNVTPRTGKGHLTNWAWDWLNMYYYEFHFRTNKINNDDIHFSIFSVNDTGFYEVENNDKTNTNSFKSIEESKSKLFFVIGKNLWKGWGNDWDEPEFILQDKGKKEDADGIMIFQSFNIEDFENEDKAMKCIIEFSKYCQENNIPIKIDNGIKR